MPNIGDLAGHLIGLLGDLIGSSSARSAVPLEVTTNDPVTAYLADSLVAAAHVRTETTERAARSHVTYVGEGRATEAARALAGGGRAGRVTTGPGATQATSHVLGSMGEEGMLL